MHQANTRSFGLVDYKVQEAEYFLLELQRVGRDLDFRAVQFTASAFVSATRSITFAIQSSLKGHPEFDSWYEAHQDAMRKDPLSRFFHKFRTVTQHIGENVVGAGVHGNEGTFYFFTPCEDLRDVPELDVLSACEAYFVSTLSVVYDCYVHFGSVVDGQQYFTKENFERLGKTIEDAEVELGFLRGWTNISDPDNESRRWHALRRHADGCLIGEQFQRWLQKPVPRPEPPAPLVD